MMIPRIMVTTHVRRGRQPANECDILWDSDPNHALRKKWWRVDPQTDRQTDLGADRQTDRPTDRQTGRQTDRQADRQTHRQTSRQTD
jgi:hypothetical protein